MFWDDKAGTKFKELFGELNRLTAAEAAEVVRKNALPGKADDYKIELPKDFTPPQGIEFTFRPDDPLLAQARTAAHEMGMSQDQFSKMLGIYAGAQVADATAIKGARDAEVAKLGANGSARVTALTTFWNAFLGDPKLGGAMMARVLTADDVQLHERIISKLSSQGAASFSPQHREPPQEQGRVSEDQYKTMTHAERLDYARRFPQASEGNGASR